MAINVEFYAGKKSELSELSTYVAGRLLFTVTADAEGEPEAHIYYDNGEKLIELYKTDLDNLSKEIVSKIDALFTASKTLKKDESGAAEVQISSSHEDNLLQSDTDGLYVPKQAGTDYSVTVEQSPITEGMAKSYIFKQANKEQPICTVDIPKDMVISDAKIEVISNYVPDDPRSGVTDNGTYLVLTIANNEGKELYVLMDRFFDAYTGKNGDEINVSISEGKEISATLNADAVSTEKIQNAAVTYEKLAADVTEKFGKMEWKEFSELNA